jgi:hypothetical protein
MNQYSNFNPTENTGDYSWGVWQSEAQAAAGSMNPANDRGRAIALRDALSDDIHQWPSLEST